MGDDGLVIDVSRAEFEELVGEALDSIPEEFTRIMDNVVVLVDDYPPDGRRILGLYEGVPLTERGQGYTFALPDKITIFQRPIEARCGQNGDRIAAEIARVVRHEIAHHFGISDERLDELERLRGEQE